MLTFSNIAILCCASTCILSATDSFETAFQQASTHFSQSQFDQAAKLYQKAITFKPELPQAHYNLGVTYLELKQLDNAEQSLLQALKLNPLYARAHVALAKIYKQQKKCPDAIKHLTEALRLDPKNREGLYLIVELLKEDLRVAEAIIYLENALKNFPDDIKLQFTLANTLNMGGHTQEALNLYLKINAMHPNDAGLLYNIAYTYKKLGCMKECLPYYDKALALNPTHSEARFSQGLAYLVLGDFERGWEGYEYRWDRSDNLKIRTYNEPQWNGIDSLEGKILFVYAEQGLGDTFQFIRYLRHLKQQGAYIIFAPQRPLMDILKLCPYIDELIPFNQRPSYFDYHTPLVSLPYLCKTRIDTIPCDIPYLYADQTLIEYWRKKLEHDTNFRIGICWQGNSQYNTAFLRAAVAEKSTTAAMFEPLTHIPGVTVYSLQHVTGTEQLASLPKTMKLQVFNEDFDSSHGRFCDTAALMMNLDLIVTIDTSTCHIAAALGVPVWNLLPNPPDWRWMLERTDTPWYPNMRLFRQPTPGDWQSSINAVVQEVKRIICPENTPAPILPTQDTSIPLALPTARIESWGILLNTLAHNYILHEITTDSQKKHFYADAIQKLESCAAEQLAASPLVRDYVKTLCAIHTQCQKEQDHEILQLFEQMKQDIIRKIDLLIRIQD